MSAHDHDGGHSGSLSPLRSSGRCTLKWMSEDGLDAPKLAKHPL